MRYITFVRSSYSGVTNAGVRTTRRRSACGPGGLSGPFSDLLFPYATGTERSSSSQKGPLAWVRSAVGLTLRGSVSVGAEYPKNAPCAQRELLILFPFRLVAAREASLNGQLFCGLLVCGSLMSHVAGAFSLTEMTSLLRATLLLVISPPVSKQPT
jgi:hypothetical protein